MELRAQHTAIEWAAVRGVLGPSVPVSRVWQRQCDGRQRELERIASTPQEQISERELGLCYSDWAFSELQPDLLRHLLPVCLLDWKASLHGGRSCSHGDAEFHLGLVRGNVIAQYFSAPEERALASVLTHFLLGDMDRVPASPPGGIRQRSPWWLLRLNSLGVALADVSGVWDAWWALPTLGSAIALIHYVSGFVYEEGSNPLVQPWTGEGGGGGPYLWDNDSFVYDRGWQSANITMLRLRLTRRRLQHVVEQALFRLKGTAYEGVARELLGEFSRPRPQLLERLERLPELLASKERVWDWW